jgi:hypothetical protein
MFDGVQVWRIRRKEQQGRACLLDEPCRFRRGMKRGVVHDHEVLGIQTRAQPRLEPGIEDRRIAGPIEQVRFFESPVHASRNQRGAWPSMPGDQAVYTLAFWCIPIASRRRRGKPTFIDVDGLFAATQEPLAQTEEPFSLKRVALVVPQSFFYESPPVFAVRSRYNIGKPGNAVPVLLASDQGVPLHAGAPPPNPVCGAAVDRGACRPRRQASASGRRSPRPPETAEPLRPCCHHLEQNPPPVGANLRSIACPYDRTNPPRPLSVNRSLAIV